jgi:hypothetical protein
MMMFFSLVLSAAASLRGASQSMAIAISRLMPQMLPVPRWNTGRLWLLRLGLYKLNRAKERANDWVWIVDHSVQIGIEKCFVILGIRLSELQGNEKPLKHQDVEPIELLPVKKSNGDIVFQQLQKATQKTGIPREIIGDYGTDLKRGIEQFCQQHPETCYIYDIKHKTAVILKRELEDDETWNEFNRLACQTRKKVLQTSLAHLAPSNPRVKSRYMNMEHLVDWGKRICAFLRNPCQDEQTTADKVMERFGWVKAFEAAIEEWGEMLQVMKTTEAFIRDRGFYGGCSVALAARLRASHHQRTERIRKEVIEFVESQSAKAQPGERLLGSSEVIESVFGKLKRMEQHQSTSGLTALALSIGAMVSTTTKDVIRKAVETVSTKSVLTWSKDNLGNSVQSKRNKFRAGCRNAEQKWDQLLVAA